MLSIYFRKAFTLLVLLTLWSMASSIHARGVNHDAEIKCIATALYYEARGESNRGKEAVAHVIINRMNSRHWPSTACGVVYERNAFSWTTRPHLRGAINYRFRRTRTDVFYRLASDIYFQELMGTRRSIVNNATFFNSKHSRPRGTKLVTRIGGHSFYSLRS